MMSDSENPDDRNSIDAIVAKGHDTARGLVYEVSEDSVWVRFPEGVYADRMLTAEDMVHLTLRVSHGQGGFRTLAKVGELDPGEVQGYRFVMADTAEFQRSLNTAAGGLNRRGAYRLELDPAVTSIPVEIDFGRGSHPRGVIVDISATGLGARVAKSELDLAVNTACQLTFELPGNTTAQHFYARLRAVRSEEDHILYGFEYDARRTPGFDWQESGVISFVMREQRALIRRLRASRPAGLR